MELSRRNFLIGTAATVSLIAAPAIVRITSIMPVRDVSGLLEPRVYGYTMSMSQITKTAGSGSTKWVFRQIATDGIPVTDDELAESNAALAAKLEEGRLSFEPPWSDAQDIIGAVDNIGGTPINPWKAV